MSTLHPISVLCTYSRPAKTDDEGLDIHIYGFPPCPVTTDIRVELSAPCTGELSSSAKVEDEDLRTPLSVLMSLTSSS